MNAERDMDTQTDAPAQQPLTPWQTLTPREAEIAKMLALGETNREIAKALWISIKTVDTHRGHILKKLKCRNNVALVRYMLREGVVSL